MSVEPEETTLDPDQFDMIRRILRRAGVTNHEAPLALARAVAATMSQFIAERAAAGYGMTSREIHDRLRALMRLAEQPDPPVGQIRVRLKELPEDVAAEIEERAERRWPYVLDEPAPGNLTQGWLVNLPGDKLVALVQRSVSNGGMIVPGRRRESGRRSQPRYESLIRGFVRGSRPSSKSATVEEPTGGSETDVVANGRPRDDDALELISFLAVDWVLGTEQRPVAGRSDKTPFGDFVHQVFGWLGLPDATGALRRYWRERAQGVERERARQIR